MDDLEITVLEMDAHRIAKVRVRRVAEVEETRGTPEEGEPSDKSDERTKLSEQVNADVGTPATTTASSRTED